MTTLTPSRDAFLNAPIDEVARLAPKAIVYAAAGTRRSALLAGQSTQNHEFAHWLQAQLLGVTDTIFRHGVEHIFTLAIGPGQFSEVGHYRDRVIEWFETGLLSPEALAGYRRLGCRVRLWGDFGIAPMARIAQRLDEETGDLGPHTLWHLVIPSRDWLWECILSRSQKMNALTRRDAIRAVYGLDLPDVTLYISFGKPVISSDLLPPLLADKVDCYWTQRPGYTLTDQELRFILYDSIYTRSTWRSDKTGRANHVVDMAGLWQRELVLGLGDRHGPFWYPRHQSGMHGTESHVD